MPSQRNVALVFASVGLSVATLYAISAARNLPYSPARVAITDALSMPGGIVGALVAFGGVHGRSPMLWATAAICGNVLFYAFVWWLILRGIMKMRSRAITESKGAVHD